MRFKGEGQLLIRIIAYVHRNINNVCTLNFLHFNKKRFLINSLHYIWTFVQNTKGYKSHY